MFDVVEHVAGLPTNVIEDVFCFLLARDVRPLTFSRILEIRDLAIRRLWESVVVLHGDTDILDIPDSIGVVMKTRDLETKLLQLWEPPCRFKSLVVNVMCGNDMDERQFLPEVVDFFNRHARLLVINLEVDGDFNPEEDENKEIIGNSVLGQLGSLTSLSHLLIVHSHFKIPIIDFWDEYTTLPESLKLFRYYDDYPGVELSRLRIPDSVTRIEYAFTLSWPRELPPFPKCLKTLVIVGFGCTRFFPHPLPSGLEQLWAAEVFPDDISHPLPKELFSEWPSVPSPVTLIALLPPNTRHNLVAE